MSNFTPFLLLKRVVFPDLALQRAVDWDVYTACVYFEWAFPFIFSLHHQPPSQIYKCTPRFLSTASSKLI